MMIIIGIDTMRVSRPSSRSRPPTNSMPEANGVRISGAGMPHSRKFSIMRGRKLSFCQPVHRNTQPTTMRMASGGSQVKQPATERGQS